MEKAQLTIVLGGVRSGKSKTAERQAFLEAERLGGCLHYVACGQVTDEEMAARVRSHQRERKESGRQWTTWEQPVAVGDAAKHFKKQDTVLIDCLTTWLTNEWFTSSRDENDWVQPAFYQNIQSKIQSGIDQIRKAAGAVVIVSNELSYEPFASPLVFHYAKALGELHQWLVKEAALAVLVEHGYPLAKKKGANA